jgi:N-acetylmuramate 1-kinase
LTSRTAEAVWRLQIDNEEATRAIAGELAHVVQADDLVTLSGELGAGKTTLARALIGALTGDPDPEVPSPTFTLMQLYQGEKFPIVHADLYRLADPEELAQLGWEEASEGALVLVEWADRAGDQLPADRLDVALALDVARGDEARIATLTG